MNENYILTKIKLNNFYGIYNTKDIENKKMIKNLFDYKKIKDKEFIFDEYTTILYNELIDILSDCLQLQLKTLYQYLFKKEENDLNKIYKDIPKEILEVIEKNIISLENIKIIDVIDIKDRKSPIMYYLSWYCDSLQDTLEIFFETKKYMNTRKKFLEREEGKINKLVLEKYCDIKEFNK